MIRKKYEKEKGVLERERSMRKRYDKAKKNYEKEKECGIDYRAATVLMIHKGRLFHGHNYARDENRE